MILEIRGVANQETQSQQRLVLKAIADGNLSDYAVVDNTYKDGIPSNLHKHYYSFPDQPIKKGDFVWLVTSTGTNTKHKNDSDTITYVFYWNLDVSVWNKVDTAHLLKIVASSDKKI